MRFDVDPTDNTQVVLKTITAFVNGDRTHKPIIGSLPLDIAVAEMRDLLLVRLGKPVVRVGSETY